MKIATYNMLQGGSVGHWSKVLEATDASLFFAQETKNPAEFRQQLLQPLDLTNAVWALSPNGMWGSAVYARAATVKTVSVPRFEGLVVGGSLKLGSHEIFAFSVHMPPRKAPDRVSPSKQPGTVTEYVIAANLMLDELGPIVGGAPLVLGGDWNLTVGHSHADEGVPNRAGEVELLDRLERDFGVVSSWPTFNAGRPLPQTLRWVKDPVPAFHCDGIFVPANWAKAIRSAHVLVGDDWTRLSDHNPVVVELDEAAFV